MQHHSHCTVYNGQSSQRCEISASVMQGSAIGPAMFDVEAAELKAVTPENLLCKYADDTVQYIVIPASNSYIQTTELAHVNLWAKLKNLSLNRAKTVETIFAYLYKKNLKSFITVKAHCSMTHLKQQKSFGLF